MYIPSTTRLHIPLIPLVYIILFIKSHILFLHILLVFAHLTCLAHLVLHFSLFHYTFYSLFLFFTYIYMLLCGVTFINLYSLHCPLSGLDLIYISLLIIPCIIYYVTNKETLTLTLTLGRCGRLESAGATG